MNFSIKKLLIGFLPNLLRTNNITNITPISTNLTNRLWMIKTIESKYPKMILKDYTNLDDRKLSRSYHITKHLSDSNYYPKIYYRDNNFSLEEYISSTPTSDTQYKDYDFMTNVLDKLYLINKSTDNKLEDMSDDHIYNECLRIYGKLEKLDLANNFKKSVNWLLDNYPSQSKQFFSHGNLVADNILIRKDTINQFSKDRNKELVFIDWKFAGYNPPLYDLANIFNQQTISYNPDSLMGFVVRDEDTSKCQMELFNYYQNLYKLDNSDLQKKDLLTLRILSHVYWGLWSYQKYLINKDMISNFNYLYYYRYRVEKADKLIIDYI